MVPFLYVEAVHLLEAVDSTMGGKRCLGRRVSHQASGGEVDQSGGVREQLNVALLEHIAVQCW